MTVCIAALFRWNYAPVGKPEDLGVNAIIASDRMITAGDVEYEPNQLKVAYVSKNAMVIIAGQYPMHTQALKELVKRKQVTDQTTPETIALLYGKAIQKIRVQLAEDAYLAPFGMNTDTFIAQQRDMAPDFVERITTQLQEFQGPGIEAIIVGLDLNQAEIWAVDYQGTVRCFDDVGFHAIGIGADHANLSLMQVGYTNSWRFAEALAATYSAKKSAETAPGVGTKTDLHLVGRHGWAMLWPEAYTSLEKTYVEYRQKLAELQTESVKQLSVLMGLTKSGTVNVEAAQQSTGADAKTDASAHANAAETTRGDEGGKDQGGKENGDQAAS